MTERIEKDLYVNLEDGGHDVIDKKEHHALCQLRIVVDNVLYSE